MKEKNIKDVPEVRELATKEYEKYLKCGYTNIQIIILMCIDFYQMGISDTVNAVKINEK